MICTSTAASGLRQSVLPGVYRVGAAAEMDVTVDELTVSREHVQLMLDATGHIQLTDLESRNGTWVNGERLVPGEAYSVTVDDQIRLGEVALQLASLDGADVNAAVAGDVVDASIPVGRDEATLVEAAVSRFCVRELPSLMQLARTSADPVTLSSRLVAALHRVVPEASFVIATEDAGQVAKIGPGGMVTQRLSDSGWRLTVSCDLDAGMVTLTQLGQLALDLLVLADRELTRDQEPAMTAASEVPLPIPETTHGGLATLYEQARRIAVSDISVLIGGETGTGKEVIAHFLHRASGRGAASFVELNCAALPEDLLEAELFGIESGVATGVTARPGKFELANDGTLLLDEIGDMSLTTQAKILRVLQEQQVFRLGAQKPRPARVRVLAATNQPIADMVENGRFRRDLYHRIADWTVNLPPLRERGDDIVNLAAHFLRAETARQQLAFGGISEKAAALLTAYSWPGNVRELEREMKRCALFLQSSEMLRGDHLQAHIVTPSKRSALSADLSLKSQLQATEAQLIEHALAAADGDMEQAARQLGMGRSTLYRRLRELGI